jgi:uncharacterized protein YbjQ (UPF0145 family)
LMHYKQMMKTESAEALQRLSDDAQALNMGY